MDFRQALEKHRDIFPEATIQSQLLKFTEEYNELQESKGTDNYDAEYGDVIFVAISLRRWPETRGIADYILDNMYFRRRIDVQKTIMKQLEETIKRVRQRKYYYDKGLYYRNKEEKDVIETVKKTS